MRFERVIPIAITLALCLAASELAGQAATERYIPVGQSPGLSGVSTYMGPIVSLDPQARTLTVQDGAERRSIQVTPQSHIWLDLSRLRRSSTNGSLSDLQVGRTVEVKYEDDETRERAYWIKVVVEQE